MNQKNVRTVRCDPDCSDIFFSVKTFASEWIEKSLFGNCNFIFYPLECVLRLENTNCSTFYFRRIYDENGKNFSVHYLHLPLQFPCWQDMEM